MVLFAHQSRPSSEASSNTEGLTIHKNCQHSCYIFEWTVYAVNHNLQNNYTEHLHWKTNLHQCNTESLFISLVFLFDISELLEMWGMSVWLTLFLSEMLLNGFLSNLHPFISPAAFNMSGLPLSFLTDVVESSGTAGSCGAVYSSISTLSWLFFLVFALKCTNDYSYIHTNVKNIHSRQKVGWSTLLTLQQT